MIKNHVTFVFALVVVSYIVYVGDAVNDRPMTIGIRPIDSKYADRPAH